MNIWHSWMRFQGCPSSQQLIIRHLQEMFPCILNSKRTLLPIRELTKESLQLPGFYIYLLITLTMSMSTEVKRHISVCTITYICRTAFPVKGKGIPGTLQNFRCLLLYSQEKSATFGLYQKSLIKANILLWAQKRSHELVSPTCAQTEEYILLDNKYKYHKVKFCFSVHISVMCICYFFDRILYFCFKNTPHIWYNWSIWLHLSLIHANKSYCLQILFLVTS